MRKTELFMGLGFTIAGCVFFFLYVTNKNTEISQALAGTTGGLLAVGIRSLYRYFHLSKPKNAAVLDAEIIDMKDERNVLLRGCTAQIMYKALMWMIASFACVSGLLGADKWIFVVLMTIAILGVVGWYVVYHYYDINM